MICLDTNYLIGSVELGSEEVERMQEWYRNQKPMIAPMPDWFEFLCGPVTNEQEHAAHAFLEKIVPFAEAEATEAARLFNAVNRKRSLRVDAMIAGTAIAANARLATSNREDFEPFVAHGLQML